MKVLKIELQNINSLKCEQPIVIDFEHLRFEDVGLYAITGPTGAGKTTLLDAITIALYRKVPRFEKGSSRGGLEDVVSYGAPSGMARVTFEAQNQRYESQWDMRLTSNNGKLLGKPVETVRLKNLSAGLIIAETKTSCDEKIIEITQLNYEQFLRSVMLAQGEFAAFLSAKNSEKGLLLQQIAGDEIYRKIGETLKNRISDEKKLLEQICSKLNMDDLLSEDASVQLKVEAQQLIESLKTLEADLKKIDELINWFEQQKNLNLQKEKNESDKLQLELDIELNKSIFHQLEKHEAAEPIKATLTEVCRLEQEIDKKSNRSKEIDLDLTEIDKKILESVTNETSCKTIVSENEQIAKDWEPKLEKVIEFDTNINSHKNTISDKEKAKNEIIEANYTLTQSLVEKANILKQQEAMIEQLHSYFEQNKPIPVIEKRMSKWNTQLTNRKNDWERLNELKKKMAEAKTVILENKTTIEGIAKNHSTQKGELDSLNPEIKNLQELLDKVVIDDLLNKNNSLNSQKEQTREMIQLSKTYSELIDIQNETTNQKTRIEKQKEKLLVIIKQFDDDIIVQKQLVKDAEELYDKDQYIVSLEAERKKLKLGEPCALCGSSTHPLVEKYAEIVISDSKKRLEERKEKLEKLNGEKKIIELEQTKLNADFENLLRQISKNSADYEMVMLKFTSLNSAFKIDEKEAIEKSLKLIEDEQNTLSQQIKSSQELQKQKNLKEELLKKIEGEIKNLDIKRAELVATNGGIEKSILDFEKENYSLKMANEDVERELVKQFADCELQLPEIEYTFHFIQQLEDNVTAYNNNAKKKAEIESEIQKCNIEIDYFKRQLTIKASELKIIEDQILNLSNELLLFNDNRKGILALELSTDDKRIELHKAIEKARKALDEAITQLNNIKARQTGLLAEKISLEKEQLENGESLKKMNTVLNDSIHQSCFANREEMSGALLDDDVKTQYVQIKKIIEERKIELSTLDKKITADLESLKLDLKLDETLENTLEKRTLVKEQKDRIQKRLGEIAEKNRKNNEIKTRNANIITEKNRQEAVCLKWTTLMTVLGGSQDAFNTYVQRLTLKNLIDLANIHLYKLNRRYSLQLNAEYKPGEELNFKLMDYYQADEMRLVDTSSGGEKFIISLALALGLSDLASYNVSIGSLFIDEGFGTLDSNTLETVISTLETLKAQGKMIGIISHVDSLKERIPVQIQVLKKSNGVSVVEMN